MTELSFTHAFTLYRSLGGVQGLLRRHRAEDARWGVNSNILAYFEPAQNGDARLHGLGLSWRSTVRQARARFARVAEGLPQPRVLGYHNCWGLPFFAGLDRADRRIGVLHSDWPGLPDCLRAVRGLVDGALCVSWPLADLAGKAWPDLPAGRISLLPYPVDRKAPATGRPHTAGRPLVLGFCGRILREQKRVDRLPSLCRALDETGLNYRLEILGDGSQAGWLRARLERHPRVKLHGRLTGEVYWRTLQEWDAIVFVSDYEGLPIALLEAMSVGAVPIYPRIGCGGGDYVRQVDERLWYGAGDLTQAAALAGWLHGLPHGELQRLRDRAGEAVRPHLGDNYFRTFREFLERMGALPRVSRCEFPPRVFHWSDHVPFGLLRRFYLRGFWKGDER